MVFSFFKKREITKLLENNLKIIRNIIILLNRHKKEYSKNQYEIQRKILSEIEYSIALLKRFYEKEPKYVNIYLKKFKELHNKKEHIYTNIIDENLRDLYLEIYSILEKLYGLHVLKFNEDIIKEDYDTLIRYLSILEDKINHLHLYYYTKFINL